MATDNLAHAALRWTARIIGALLVGLVLLFAIGEGVRLQDFDAVTGSMKDSGDEGSSMFELKPQ